MRAIKAESVITFAQDLESAKFGGMPHGAIESGVVDYVLPAPAIAREIVRLGSHGTKHQRATRPTRLTQTGHVERPERELVATKDDVQSLIDDHRQLDDELNAANEELQSMNEEIETA